MSFKEICLEADKARNNMNRLTELWEYIRERKNCFTPSHFEFMKEHLNNYAGEIKKKRAADYLKNYFNEE